MVHRTQLSLGGAMMMVRYGTVDADLLVHHLVLPDTARLITKSGVPHIPGHCSKPSLSHHPTPTPIGQSCKEDQQNCMLQR